MGRKALSGPDELRKRLHDCWYFTKDGCKCMYCESKNPKHHEDCPVAVGLAAADAWEAKERAWSDSVFRHAATINKLAKERGITAALRQRLEAAELTIGTLQADRIKSQATIDHYRTMLAAAETLLTDVRESAVEFRDPRIGYVTVQMDRGTWDALAGEEKP